ncbi:hypothetical protein AMTR_s00041p00141220 [Amborella trichopoda]|uniref:Uncharacterized protein n=1 Tax=Amborella trichopoda TaxID=13333 RepID=W1PZ12_AMBTC|nr:hypothetical protein AMTR_s00041p00141220 [Amborella trichopoda]
MTLSFNQNPINPLMYTVNQETGGQVAQRLQPKHLEVKKLEITLNIFMVAGNDECSNSEFAFGPFGLLITVLTPQQKPHLKLLTQFRQPPYTSIQRKSQQHNNI